MSSKATLSVGGWLVVFLFFSLFLSIWQNAEDKVSKFVFVGTGDNIAQVFVRGTQVGPIPVEKFDV